jgi:hypothetical protein
MKIYEATNPRVHTDAESKFRRHSSLSRPWGYNIITVFAHVTWMKTCEIARNITKRDRSRPDLQKCQVSCACQTETIYVPKALQKKYILRWRHSAVPIFGQRAQSQRTWKSQRKLSLETVRTNPRAHLRTVNQAASTRTARTPYVDTCGHTDWRKRIRHTNV